MIDIEKFRECENSFYKNFTDQEVRSYGKLFFNSRNKTSHDSNHAIITHFGEDLRAALGDIKSFYQGRDLVPRVYQAFLSG